MTCRNVVKKTIDDNKNLKTNAIYSFEERPIILKKMIYNYLIFTHNLKTFIRVTFVRILFDFICSLSKDIPVYGVNLIRTPQVKAGTTNDIEIDLQILMNRNAQNARGTNLWKVRMWTGTSRDGSGVRIGYREQVRLLL